MKLFVLLIPIFAMAAAPPRVDPNYGNLPMPFEPNRGQAASGVHFLSSVGGLAIHDDGATIASDARMRLVGSMAPRQIRALDKLPGISSYFNGPDESKWLRDIPQYRRVMLEGVYKGVDLVFYGTGSTVEYDFVIAPQADPRSIAYRFDKEASLDTNGDLVVKVADGEVRHHRPVAYQRVNGKKRHVEARFTLREGMVRFVVGHYDRSKELVIDPSIAYSYFFNGTARAVVADSVGAAYFIGFTLGPVGNRIIKINAAGTAVAFTANISQQATVSSLAVDTNGSVYVAGSSGPGLATKNPLQVFTSGFHAFVAKFNAAGNDLVYSTYLGGSGSDGVRRVVADSTGAAYLAGTTTSPDLPLKNPAQATLRGATDSFLMKLNPQGSELLLSTYFGGGARIQLYGLALDSTGSILIAGSTDDTNLELTRPLFTNGSTYLVRFLPSGIIDIATLVPLTISSTLAVDTAGNAYMAGYPNTAFLPSQPSGAMVARINFATRNLQALVTIPGTPSVMISAVAVDANGAVYATGEANDKLPLLKSILPFRSRPSTFVLKAANDGTLIYSSILGPQTSGSDIAVDSMGRAYVAGGGFYGEFPGVNTISPLPTTSRFGAFVLRITDTPDLVLVKTIVEIEIGAYIGGGLVGITLTVDGIPFSDSQEFYWPSGETHTISVVTTFLQGDGVRYTFQNWSDGGALTHSISPTSDSTIRAVFKTEREIITSVVGSGSISVSPPSAKSDGYYSLGTKVTFTASPGPGQFFNRWGGALRTANPSRSLFVPYSIIPIRVTALFTPTPPAVYEYSLGYVPITPCRVMDTRPGEGKTGAFGPPFLAGGSTRTLTVSDGTCNIPARAKAFALNATVVPLMPLSYLTIYPAGQTRPNVSTLNAFEGQVVANNTIVPIGDNNSINVFATDDTHVVLDINGYFIDTEESLSFYSLLPCRVLDTRTGAAPAPIPGGAFKNFTIPSSCLGFNPGNVQAVALNFTVVPRGSLDYITAWPAGTSRPLASTLNSPQGRTLANSAIVPLGANGEISVYASQTTDLVVDINGYFAPGPTTNTALTSLRFYATPPCRLADTRTLNEPILAGSRRLFLFGSCVAGGSALSLNATAVPIGPLPYLTLFNGPNVPLASTLNAENGQIVANGTIVAGNGGVSAYAPATTHLILDLNGYFAP